MLNSIFIVIFAVMAIINMVIQLKTDDKEIKQSAKIDFWGFVIMVHLVVIEGMLDA